MAMVFKKKNIKAFLLIFIIIILFFLHLLYINKFFHQMKYSIGVDVFKHYIADVNPDLHIDDFVITEEKVKGNIMIFPNDSASSKNLDQFYYSFKNNELTRSESKEGVWTITEDSPYYYHWETYIKEHDSFLWRYTNLFYRIELN